MGNSLARPDGGGIVALTANREKWASRAVAGLIALVGVGFLWNYHGEIVDFLADMMHAVWLAAGLVVSGLVLLNPMTHNVLRTIYRAIVHNTIGFIVDLTPVAFLRSRIVDMQEDLDQMRSGIADIDGVKNSIERELADNRKALTKQQNMVLAGDDLEPGELDRETRMSVQLASQEVGRLMETVEEQEFQLTDVANMLEAMRDVADAVEFGVRDTKAAVENLVRRLRLSDAVFKATSKGRDALDGRSADREAFDLAVERVNNTIDRQVGYARQFVHDTKGLVASARLDRAARARAGLASVEQLRARAAKIRKEGQDGGQSTPMLTEQHPSAMPIVAMPTTRAASRLLRGTGTDDKKNG